MAPTFNRLAVVNRGVAAVRLVQAAREYGDERGRPLRTIVVHTDEERGSQWVREADEAVSVGPGSVRDGESGRRLAAYHDLGRLEDALRRARADAVWVGWGPLARQPEVAELCDRLGMVLVGPSAHALRRLADAEDLARVAAPLGIAVRTGDPETGPWGSARPGHKQVDVLVMADHDSGTWAVGILDGTLQRREEKVLVETPPTWVSETLERRLRRDAACLIESVGWSGAATVSFWVRPEDEEVVLAHVSAGLPLGHPATELCSPLDLHKLQLEIAEGRRLQGDPPPERGFAMAARLIAEDAEQGFAPAPGRVVLLRPPTSPGLRIDAGPAEGDLLVPDLDPTLAEIAAWGASRDEARTRLRQGLVRLPVVLDGGTTNKGFLVDLLDRDEVRRGDVDTTWLDRMVLGGGLGPEGYNDVALLVAAVDAYDAAHAQDRARFLAAARRGRPTVRSDDTRDVELCHDGFSVTATVARTGPQSYRVRVGVDAVDLTVERIGPFQSRISIGDKHFRVVSDHQHGDHIVEVEGVPHRISRDDHGVLATEVPGVVVLLPVVPGQHVRAGDTVAVVESMKMETRVRAPFDGRVRELLATVNTQVDAGAPLVRVDAETYEALPPRQAPLHELATSARDSRSFVRRSIDGLDVLQRLVLGYDVDDALVKESLRAVADLPAAEQDDEVLAAELRLLGTYADLRAVFRPERDADETDLRARSPQEYLHAFLRAPESGTTGLAPRFVAALHRALAHYGVEDLEPSPALSNAAYRMFQSQAHEPAQAQVVVTVLRQWLSRSTDLDERSQANARATLDRLVAATARSRPVVADLARDVRFRLVDQPMLDEVRQRGLAAAEADLAALVDEPAGPDRIAIVERLVACPYPLAPMLLTRMDTSTSQERLAALEVMTARYHRDSNLRDVHASERDGVDLVHATVDGEQGPVHVMSVTGRLGDLRPMVDAVVAAQHAGRPRRVDLYTWTDEAADLDALSAELADRLAPIVDPALEYVVVALRGPGPLEHISTVGHLTFRPDADGNLVEEHPIRGLHPMMARRLHLWRMSAFDLERLQAPEDVYVFRGVARDNPTDERLFAVAEVRDLTAVRDSAGRVVAMPQLERAALDAFEGLRRYQAPLAPTKRLQWNRVLLYVWPTLDMDPRDLDAIARSLAPASIGLGLEEILVHGRRTDPETGRVRQRVWHLLSPSGSGFVLQESDPPRVPLVPLDDYHRKVVQSRRRGTVYPYELVRMVTTRNAGGRPEVQGGSFVEHDLSEDGTRLVPVDRAPGANTCGIVAGVITNTTDKVPEGMSRVVLLGDPTRALGSLAEAECRRIIAALDLAEEMRVPLEWYALSAGARIAMDSGTENMDWISDVLRRIIEFTQAGYEVNVVVTGINVGAQPYWNAEATMLMHTKGILVMTPDSAMVLTGKQALDYSGSVSADDNFGIGGYERVMGPNGQAQYWAPDLLSALGVLLQHYEHAYVVPGERFPRKAITRDPVDRDVRSREHILADSPLKTVGEVLSDEANPGRKLGFDMRSIMRAVVDSDHAPLERWKDMRDSDTVIVWDAHLGGRPVCMIGIEGHAMQRHGVLPADGPGQWTSGTLFPMSSKKTARAVNAASGNRPLVVLANLSGFDGSPESMRQLQLEYGAEIGRAVVNFDGPIVFCVVSRYHGGAFVVFSRRLNPNLEAIALEGSHASVLGGAPAAAVVFAGEVKARTRKDPRVTELQQRIDTAEGADKGRLRAELAELMGEVSSEKLGEVAAEFDAIHNVERALSVGSVTRIIPPDELRPVLVASVERGVARTLGEV